MTLTPSPGFKISRDRPIILLRNNIPHERNRKVSSFSVSTNYYLRSLYSTDRSLISKATRDETKASSLQKADQDALRKGIRALADWDYEDDEENKKKTVKAKFYKNLKAFMDSYNYTLESGDKASLEDGTIKHSVNNMRALSKKYSEELSSLGIKTDSKGYMKISNSALDNIDLDNYEDVFGKDSKYMKALSQYSKHVSNHIDQTA